MFEITGWVAVNPGLSKRVIEFWFRLVQEVGPSLEKFLVFADRLFPALSRLVVGKSGEARGSHVTQIAEHVHYFMVPEQDLDFSS